MAIVKLLFPDLVREENGCLVWTGWVKKGGYGTVKYEGRLWLVHRLSWFLERNDKIRGINILHRCDNPPCFNPDHLFEGTYSDNLKDCWNKGRRVASHYGETHPSSKLKAADVLLIREDNRPHSKIAATYGVSRPCISMIKEGKNWRSLCSK